MLSVCMYADRVHQLALNDDERFLVLLLVVAAVVVLCTT